MPSVTIRVWDLPTRLFHWALAVSVSFSIIAIKLGGNWVPWHFRSGYVILTLLLFRLIWGIVGPYYARFSHFPLAPRKIKNAVRSIFLRTGTTAGPGHNPIGAVSILAMLAVLLFQAVSGLFANDEIASAGPLEPFVSNATSDLISDLHSFNAVVIYVLLGLHVLAILFYFWQKKIDLVTPMISGSVSIPEVPLSEPHRWTESEDDWPILLRALVILAGCALVVWFIVSRAPPAIG